MATTKPVAEVVTEGSGDVAGRPAAGAKAAFAIASFRSLWLNNVFFFLVMNAQRFVLGWLVLEGLDGNERTQGLVVFALGVPALFLVLHAGNWADRYNRKRLLVGSQIATLAVTLVAASLVQADVMTIQLAIVVALAMGATTAIGSPVRSALVPVLVPRALLFTAIAATSLAMTSSMILGPVAAKFVGDQLGFAAAFWFMSSLLAVGLVVLLPMEVPAHAHSDPAAAGTEPDAASYSVWAGSVEAFRHVVRDRALSRLFLLLTVAGSTVNPAVMVSIQAFVKEEFGRNAGDSAPILAVMGVGIAVSSFVVMRKGDMANKGALFQRALMVGSLMTFLMGRTTEYWQLLPLSLMMGLGGGFYINMNQGLIQSNTPQRMMGRVMALYTLIQAGLLPVGALTLGYVGGAVGMGTAISGAGIISLVVVLVVYSTDSEFRRLG